MVEEQPLNRHQKNKLRTRRQLEEATLRLLMEKGYDPITIQDIVDEADLGRGTFYLHFRDKEEAVWSIIQKGMQESDALAHQLAQQAPNQVNIKTGFINMFHHIDKNRELFRIMLGSRGHNVITLKVQDWLAKDLEKEMVTNFAPKPTNGVPLSITSQIVTGAVTRLAIWWLETPNPYSAEEMAEMCYQSLVVGFQWENLFNTAD